MFDSLAILERGGALTVRRFLVEPLSGPDPRLAELMSIPPSALTLAEIESYDAAELDEGERVTLLALWERHLAWTAARQQQAVVDVAGLAPTSKTADDWAEIDVAAALRLSPVSAARRVEVARQLTGRLRATQRALENGDVTFWYALSLVEAVAELDDDAALGVEQTVLDGAGSMTLARFRARLRRAVIAAAPRSADERHTKAIGDRRVVLTPQPDGMAWLSAFLTAPEAIAAYRALNDSVAADEGLDGIDVRRADAFVGALQGLWALDAPAARHDGSAGRRPAEPRSAVNVTIDLATLLRLTDHPGHLDGYGDIPPELARRLASDGDWQRFVTEPLTGHLLDFGRTTYRPPRALARYIRARDVTCRFPGCARSAMRCDLDHANAWDCEGLTCSDNLGCLCRYHHRAKTHAGWEIESRPDGSAGWRSPRGPTFERQAIDHSPEHTARFAAHRAALERSQATGDALPNGNCDDRGGDGDGDDGDGAGVDGSDSAGCDGGGEGGDGPGP